MAAPSPSGLREERPIQAQVQPRCTLAGRGRWGQTPDCSREAGVSPRAKKSRGVHCCLWFRNRGGRIREEAPQLTLPPPPTPPLPAHRPRHRVVTRSISILASLM